MSKNKTLAISLLNWNGIDKTSKCIDSIFEGIFHDFDLYLIDNGSENNEGEKLVKKYGDTENIIITSLNENKGFTGGNNVNLRKIKNGEYKYVLLLNNDTIIPKDLLENFIKEADKINDGAIFSPMVKNFPPEESIQSSGGNINLWFGDSKFLKIVEDITEVDYVLGACFLFKTELLTEVGFLDEDYFSYWEEVDFCYKAKLKGYKTYVIPQCWIYHEMETGKKKIKPYYTYLMFRNRIIFLKKHANIFQYIFSFLVLIGYLIIIFPRHFGMKNFKYAYWGIKDALNGSYFRKDVFGM